VSFRQINKKTGNRLKQQLVGEVVETGDKGRGYEIGKDEYLPVEDEELHRRIARTPRIIGGGSSPVGSANHTAHSPHPAILVGGASLSVCRCCPRITAPRTDWEGARVRSYSRRTCLPEPTDRVLNLHPDQTPGSGQTKHDRPQRRVPLLWQACGRRREWWQ
jgi:hypothetical protein